MQFQLPKHRFILRQNAPFSVFDFLFFSKFPRGTLQPPTIFLFRVNIILPTLRPWSQTLQGYSQGGKIEASTYPLQRRKMLIPCHNMIKIMHLKIIFVYVYNYLSPLPFRKFWNRHCNFKRHRNTCL